MKTKHTEGKLDIERNVIAGGINHLALTCREQSPDWMVASVTPMRLLRPIDEANAARLALAWNLHEEFKSVVRRLVSRAYSEGMHTNCTCFRCQDIEQAQAILSKATAAE